MKLIRSVVLGVLFLLGVFLASANTALVELVYLPALPFAGIDEAASLRVPVFIVVLAALLLGVVVTGLGVFVEQSRLRWTTRAALKTAKRKEQDWARLRDELAASRQDLANIKQELATSRGETRSARERLAQTEARFAKLREEVRATGKTSNPVLPSGGGKQVLASSAGRRPADKPDRG